MRCIGPPIGGGAVLLEVTAAEPELVVELVFVEAVVANAGKARNATITAAPRATTAMCDAFMFLLPWLADTRLLIIDCGAVV